MCSFWRIWSVPISHTEGDWTREVEQVCDPIPEMGAIIISPQEVARAVRPLPNWKSLQRLQARLASQFQSALESGLLPQF